MNKQEAKSTRIFWGEYKEGGVYHVGNNTIKCEDERQKYYLHGNLIASYNVNTRMLSLYTRNYRTRTTKSRLNAILESANSGYIIYQEEGFWYIKNKYKTELFIEGMEVFI